MASRSPSHDDFTSNTAELSTTEAKWLGGGGCETGRLSVSGAVGRASREGLHWGEVGVVILTEAVRRGRSEAS
jgi:hypothetical protein